MFDVTLRLKYDAQAGSAEPIYGWYLPLVASRPEAERASVQSISQSVVADRASVQSITFDIESTINNLNAGAISYDALNAGVISYEDSSTIRYYLAPRSSTEPTAGGLIALGDGPISCPLGAIGLVRMAAQESSVEFWLPREASVAPRVTPAQLSELVQQLELKCYVWLPPHVGDQPRLLGLDASDEVDLSVLLRPPSAPNSQAVLPWFAPPLSFVLPNRLTDVQADPGLLKPQSLHIERESIGNKARRLLDIDEQGEVQGGSLLDKTSRWFRKSFDQALSGLLGWLGRIEKRRAAKEDRKLRRAVQPGARSGVPSTQDSDQKKSLVSKISGRVSRLVAAQREKQLNKLLRLMERNPELALQFAFPFGDLGAPRGLSAPHGRLTRHDTDFSMSNLFAGGIRNPWSVDSVMRSKLLAAYYQQALREKAAGRYRRAAYIYAHLIGNHALAAEVLEYGKFYLEAAALYGKLEQFRDQARCLVKAGQIAQAAALYQSLGHHLDAANLWQTIGELDSARKAYQLAFDQSVKQGQIVQASQVLSEHLNDPTEAQELLWRQWPAGSETLACVRAAFAHLALGNQVDEAHRRFKRLVEQAGDAHQTTLAGLCLELPELYPSLKLGTQAEDQCRVSIAHKLDALTSLQHDQRMRILRRLHPSDALLGRDIRRYERSRQADEMQIASELVSRRPSESLVELPAVRLAAGKYSIAKMIGQELFTVFEDAGRLNCARHQGLIQKPELVDCITWSDLFKPPVTCGHYHQGVKLVVELNCGDDRTIAPRPLGRSQPVVSDWLVMRTGTRPGRLLGVGDDGVRWYLQDDGQLTAAGSGLPVTYDLSSKMAKTLWTWFQFGDGTTEISNGPEYCGLVLGREPVVSAHRTLLTVRDGQVRELTSFNDSVCFLTGSLPYTTARVLVATKNDLYIVPMLGGSRPEKVDGDQPFLQASYLPGGRIAAVTQERIHLYQRDRVGMKQRGVKQLRRSDCLAVLPLSGEVVGVLYENGLLQRWRV